MNQTLIPPVRRAFAALAISCALVAGLAPAASATAAPAPAPVSAEAGKKKVKLDASLSKKQAKVNEKVTLKGTLQAQEGGDAADSLEAIIVQQLQGSVWVNIADTTCRPNSTFSLKLSFSFSAVITLRAYHPETTLYASAYTSSNLTLRVG
ncbi:MULTISPECIES: hypothetical protein [Amycolatopsis]|uniref:Conserved putative secreted protein n=1 Tax=Amycolatopsis japonica TaxID=208439 RepID=A0A075V0X7_9PSEU|nr:MULTISPECIES: hypothetical protein [Amycolatopsis]AIG78264.1 Conserved putative secreted protein [Amycolatopsis japonica]OKJ95841.1 hypothetical protein AMK34_22910 [Amycolatopsis sp. CB00013]